jgi:hypothetical protein
MWAARAAGRGETAAMTRAADLEGGERITFLIGQVCRLDVGMERALRHAWTWMVDHPATVLVPSKFSHLCEHLKEMMGVVEVDERFRAAALKVLAEAERLHRERNRVVHDMWMVEIDQHGQVDPQQWHRLATKAYSIGGRSTTITIGDFEAVVVAMERAAARVHMLATAVPHPTLPPFPGRSEESLLRILEDRFDLMPDGGLRAHEVP